MSVTLSSLHSLSPHIHKNPASIIISGATSGLGFQTARFIAANHSPWHIVITGRNDATVQSIAAGIRKDTHNPNIHGMALDLGSFSSIHRFATRWDNHGLPPLHALVCNAAVQLVNGTRYTVDGFEMTFGVNHLGHFLLTQLLLPRMAEPGRILVVSSGTHDPRLKTGMPAPAYRHPEALARPDRHPDPSEAGRSDGWIGRRRYTTSKLCNLLFAYELSRRMQQQGRKVTVNAFDPGLMPGSGLARDYSPVQRLAWNLLLPALRLFVPNVNSTSKSGEALARLVVDPALANVTGRYFEGARQIQSSEDSMDPTRQSELWVASESITAAWMARYTHIGSLG